MAKKQDRVEELVDIANDLAKTIVDKTKSLGEQLVVANLIKDSIGAVTTLGYIRTRLRDDVNAM